MKLIDMTVTAFLDELASDSPAPGGGSVAALSGAISAGLAAMVSRLTVGREKYKDSWQAMEQVKDSCDSLIKRLKELVDLDTGAYNQVMAAFRLPKATDEDKAARSKAIQEANKKAAEIPLMTLSAIAKAMRFVETAIEKGNPNCITDAGSAAQLLRAGALAASYNVRINLGGIKDKEFTGRLAAEASELTASVLADADRLAKVVDSRLG